MKKIEVNIPGSNYPVYIGRGILTHLAEYIERHLKTDQLAIISNETVFKLYGQKIKENLSRNYQVIDLLVADGEESKSFHYLEKLYTGLLENHFERKSTILALGGGVVGDLAGYAAASYLRGINLVQVPTSLLAQVDSSIGGKTGINHALGKNMIGAFKQPAFVFSDIDVLQTLPAAEIICGLGEIIKYGFMGDAELFEYLQSNLEKALQGDPYTLEHLVTVSSAQKSYVVENDEKESGLRMVLNFGHTFGHALEAEYGYKALKHGQAIILGMKCALQYSLLIKGITEAVFEKGMGLLNRVPVEYNKANLNPEALLNRMYHDKKVSDKNIRLILIEKIGHCHLKEASDANLIKKAFEVLF